MKTCTKCHKQKSFDAFHNHSAMNDGKQSYCRGCKLAANRAYRVEKRKSVLTQKKLKELFTLDDDGVFTKIKTKEVQAVDVNGYVMISVEGVQYYAHRLVWLWHRGNLPIIEIDHINHQRSDNRLDNLRTVSHRENGKNQSMYKNNTSGVTGIYLYKATGKWSTFIEYHGKRIHLGYFKDKDEAIRIRKKAERKLGFHENHGST
jgi:hypothetical protein